MSALAISGDLLTSVDSLQVLLFPWKPSPAHKKKLTLVCISMPSMLPLKEKFGLFVDFEFLTEMGSWDTD